MNATSATRSHPRAQDGAPPAHTNRLIDETSPYLLQHAHNPVDWFAWGEEAIERARAENKLIFLSVGYSTCYWCHVMERESFENEEIAAVMNEHFVNIKVDREERPDVDDIYMNAVQLMTQRGGWPMSVWIEPQTLRPVYAGTYFPDEPRHGMASFTQVCEAVAQAWRERPDQMRESAAQIAEAIEQNLAAQPPAVAVNANDVNRALNALLTNYDPDHGGFGAAPKFPQPVYLELLLGVREWLDEESVEKLDQALRHTLDRMAMGGMYDQVGGGFHRYSTDEKWLVPHFEKMLYDNGQLASVYARAHEIYGDAYYAEIVRETLDYVLREMRDDGGGFYSAQDAEVNAREGQNYLWTPDQVRAALEQGGLDEHIDFVLNVYGLDQGTNFQDPHHPEEPPSNVLYLVDRPDALAAKHELSIDEFNARLARVNEALLKVRNRRDQPGTDDKILVSWNGLMIAGLADGGRVLNESRYIDAAVDAARFILSEMRSDDGGLLRAYRDGRAKVDAFLEDYAMLIRGLIALDRATGDATWRKHAIELLEIANARFRDEDYGAYFDTLPDQPDLFVRSRSMYDGAVPSGNSIMLLNLLDLYELTGEERFFDQAESTLAGLSSAVSRAPAGAALATLGVMRIAANYPERLPGGAPGPRAPGDKTPVIITTSAKQIRVTPDGSEPLLIEIDIASEYHINAHEPGDPKLIGLLVNVVGGEGIVAQPDYPLGELYQDSIRVHEGAFILPVRFAKIGPASGEPKVEVRWQTCTDTECLAPESKVLDVELIIE